MLAEGVCAAFVGVFCGCLLQVADPVQSRPAATQPASDPLAAKWRQSQ